MNSWDFIGRLAADPSIRDAGGKPVCSLRLAVRTQDRENDTTWVSASVWGKPAEWCAERLRKGDQVAISGAEVRVREYTTRDGEKRTRVEAGGFDLRVHFIEPREGNPNKPGPVKPAPAANPSAVFGDDNVPF